MSVVNLIAPINNMQVRDGHAIRLDENFEIHKIPEHVRKIIVDAKSSGFVRHPTNATHCLLIKNAEVSSEDGTDAKETIEESVLRLRIYKAGGCYFDFGLIDEVGWFYAPDKNKPTPLKAIGVFFYIAWERKGMASLYQLEEVDIEPLGGLFKKTKNIMLLDQAPFRYFFRGYHEPYATDRFLSNAIALENIFANDQDDKSNIRYKFIDRGCFLLQQAQPHPEGPNGYVKPLADIYDSRSRLVHSTKASKRDWNEDSEIKLLFDSEVFLRQALLYIVDNPEMINSNKIDVLKRQKY
jgi:hypothetical protein